MDASEAFRTLELLDGKIEETKEELIDATKEVEAQTKASFNEVKGMMRASYMMISGISTVLGGDMGRVFSAMYGMGVAAIGTFKAVAAAIAATGPVGWIQAAMMASSLLSATVQLGALMDGQNELSQRMHGVTMSLHGIQGLIGVFDFD